MSEFLFIIVSNSLLFNVINEVDFKHIETFEGRMFKHSDTAYDIYDFELSDIYSFDEVKLVKLDNNLHITFITNIDEIFKDVDRFFNSDNNSFKVHDKLYRRLGSTARRFTDEYENYSVYFVVRLVDSKCIISCHFNVKS